MPTPFAKPWPSGPVVISTPGVSPYSGWPGVFDPNWRKFLISSSDKIVTGEMQQRIKQHRTVTGRQQKAIAIFPLWILRIVSHESASTAHRPSAPRPAANPDGPIRLLYRIERKRANCVDAKLIEVGSRCGVFLLHWCAHFTVLVVLSFCDHSFVHLLLALEAFLISLHDATCRVRKLVATETERSAMLCILPAASSASKAAPRIDASVCSERLYGRPSTSAIICAQVGDERSA